MNILLLIGGLILILLGANGLTDGAASVAKRFRIPPIVIGLTIVAFGTSAPELTVSISSALKGSADIAIGNVVGSNIFNTLMIVGCTALFAPIVITRNTLRKEIPLCILSSIVLLICANDVFLDKAPENIPEQSRRLIITLFLCHLHGLHLCHRLQAGHNGTGGTDSTSDHRRGDRNQITPLVEIHSLYHRRLGCPLFLEVSCLLTALRASPATWVSANRLSD